MGPGRDEHRPCLQLALGHPERLLDEPQALVHVQDVLVGHNPVQLEVAVCGVPVLAPERFLVLSKADDVGAHHVVAVELLVLVYLLLVQEASVVGLHVALPGLLVHRHLLDVLGRPVVAGLRIPGH